MTSNKKIKTKTKNEVNIQNISGYLSMSFNDYIAARILINRNKLIQGCILANTAIEKYFKALMEAQGTKSFGQHDLTKQLPFIKNQYPRIYKKLNIDFLNQLTKIYKSRYLDDLPIGYNFAIIQGKYLAELDFIYSTIEPTIRVQNNTNNNSKTKYELAVENKDSDLWTGNYLLNNLEKTVFVEQPCNIQEFRVLPNGVFLEILYAADTVKNDNIFNYEALIPSENLKSFNHTHIRIN